MIQRGSQGAAWFYMTEIMAAMTGTLKHKIEKINSFESGGTSRALPALAHEEARR